jgi:hypothetical protein
MLVVCFFVIFNYLLLSCSCWFPEAGNLCEQTLPCKSRLLTAEKLAPDCPLVLLCIVQVAKVILGSGPP